MISEQSAKIKAFRLKWKLLMLYLFLCFKVTILLTQGIYNLTQK